VRPVRIQVEADGRARIEGVRCHGRLRGRERWDRRNIVSAHEGEGPQGNTRAERATGDGGHRIGRNGGQVGRGVADSAVGAGVERKEVDDYRIGPGLSLQQVQPLDPDEPVRRRGDHGDQGHQGMIRRDREFRRSRTGRFGDPKRLNDLPGGTGGDGGHDFGVQGSDRTSFGHALDAEAGRLAPPPEVHARVVGAADGRGEVGERRKILGMGFRAPGGGENQFVGRRRRVRRGRGRHPGRR